MTIEEKIKILGLKPERVEELSNLFVEEIDFMRKDNASIYEETIEVDLVVGSTRGGWAGLSWLDVLEQRAHKEVNFSRYNASKFAEILMNPEWYGHPCVVKKENKYYIEGDGLHRLTIARCLGNQKARVAVIDY